MLLSIAESYEFAEADAISRSIPKERLSALSEFANGKRNPFLVTPNQTDKKLKNDGNICDRFPPNFKCFPSGQLVPNPDLDPDENKIEVGRLIPLSGGSVEFPLDGGLLNFLYADFEKACDTGNLTFEQERKTDPIPMLLHRRYTDV